MEELPAGISAVPDPYVLHADLLRARLSNPEVNRFEHEVNAPALLAMMPSLIADRKLVRRVLDFGCGAGDFTKKLAGQYPRATVMGADKSRAMLPQNPQLPNLQFEQWDGRSALDQPPFDLIVSKMALHYIDNESFETVLHNLAGSLAPKGWLITSLPAPKYTAVEAGVQNRYMREIGSTGIEGLMFSHSGFIDGVERVLSHLPGGYTPFPRHAYGEDDRLRRYNTVFCPEAAWKRLFRRAFPVELDSWVDAMVLPPTRAFINRRHARHSLKLVQDLLDLQ